LAGQIDFMIGSISDFGPHIQSGAIKAYASASAARSQALPDVPTSQEAGLPEFQAGSWWALFAPKGTPGPVLETLSGALDKALDDETVTKRFADLGSRGLRKEKRGQQPLAAFVKSEIARWTPIIRAATSKPD
jgi:tripartite-type tricarboxylate transporter receptor subunit TctC